MTSRLQRRRTHMLRKTARVFFSSPFGGLEEEREELTKKYWPQLESMCSKAGYEFIPVDLRWGITSEMSSSAVTIKVCLSEMDRSDMIVGFFGQRYGWHGNNELLQKSFDVAAVKYPWVNEYRDRAVTELEFLHGHLRNPGARPACFFFRDKAYDDKKLEEALAKDDQQQIRKFRAITDGPNAAELLDNLKRRVEDTWDKCLAVHMSYATPQEGARLMFETIKKYFNEVLLASPAESLKEQDLENVQHDVFLASRLGMGGAYVGGAKYISMIDRHLSTKGQSRPIVVLGNAGSGKSCLLSNWITAHQLRHPTDVIVYHFVGSSSESTVPKFLLSRLVNELFEEVQEKQINNNVTFGPLDEGLRAASSDNEPDLIRKIRALTAKLTETGASVFLVVDALNKVDVTGQTMKALYWLPKDLPHGAHLVASTLASDTANIRELETRGCETISIAALQHSEREEIALATLKIRGKTLSTQQRERIFQKQQTQNPLYLKTLLQELLSFGEFFQLDAYIDDLLEANDTKGLFTKFLKRLETDYNPEDFDGNLIEQVLSCILVCRQGLSENELKSILQISDQNWSALYFALDDFLVFRSGLYNFAYDELRDAVQERYCQSSEKRKEFIVKVVNYFEEKLGGRSLMYDTTIPTRVLKELSWLLKNLGDSDRLVACLLHPAVFYSLRSGLDQYDLANYWAVSGLDGDTIVAKQKKVIDDQMILFYNEAIDKGNDQKSALRKMSHFVYELAQFLENAGYLSSVEPLLERALQMERALYGEDAIQTDADAAERYVNIANTLACLYVDTEQFDKADTMHREVLHIKEKFAEKWERGAYYLAVGYNGLGVLNYRQNKFKEAEEFYNKALEKHHEAKSGLKEIAELHNNIGVTHFSMGEYNKAANSFEEALKLYDEVFFGHLPPDVGGTILNLAMIYRRLEGKHAKAEPLYQRALEIRENAYGPNHHEVGQTLLSYSAYVLYSDSAKAVELAKRAVGIYEASLGLSHINTLNALENVALGYLVMDKKDEAHEYFKKAGEEKSKTGRMETSIQKMNAIMADYYLNSGQNDEARQLFSRIVQASWATERDFAALDFLDSELPERPARPFEHSVEHAIKKFPKSQMLLGRLQVKYSKSGNARSMLQVLANGDFGVEQYNLAYKSFNEENHKREGMEILIEAHNKFPEDKIIMHNLSDAHAHYREYKAACAVLQKLMKAGDDPEVATLELYARMLSLSGRPHDGREMYAKALKQAEKTGDEEAFNRLNSTVKLLNEM